VRVQGEVPPAMPDALNAKETPRRPLFSRHAGWSMTAAFQPRTNGPVNRGQSRFFASPSRAPRRRNPRPGKRLTGRKTAPGIFFAAPPKTHPETATQSLGTHQESVTYVFVFASGCAVAPNSTASSGVNWGQFGKGVLSLAGGVAGAVITMAETPLSVTGIGVVAVVGSATASAGAIGYGIGNIVAAFSGDPNQQEIMNNFPSSIPQAVARGVGGQQLQDTVGTLESFQALGEGLNATPSTVNSVNNGVNIYQAADGSIQVIFVHKSPAPPPAPPPSPGP
jgi:hypothetical protein